MKLKKIKNGALIIQNIRHITPHQLACLRLVGTLHKQEFLFLKMPVSTSITILKRAGFGIRDANTGMDVSWLDISDNIDEGEWKMLSR